MINAAIAVQNDVVESHTTSKPSDRVARRWLCDVSVRIAHSCPLLAAGLVATLQQVPGYDVALADESSSARHQTMGVIHVLITDRRSDFHHSGRGFSGPRSGCLPRPRVVLLTNEPALAGCRDGQATGVDACLPMNCPAEDMLAAVRQLGHTALGPLSTPRQDPSFDQPARGGLAPIVLRTVRRYIEDHLAAGAGLDCLARIAGMSSCHFSRAFKRSTGMPAHRYLITRRISAAIALIRESDRALCEISLEVGFADQSHFTRTFVQLTGVTPGEFRHRCH